MSNDQIIRSSKPHEVTIPEGSNNARSLRNKVGQRDVEQEHKEKVTLDNHITDKTVSTESQAITDQQVALEQDTANPSGRVKIEQDQGVASGRVKVEEGGDTADHRVKIEASHDPNHQVKLQTQEAPSGTNLVQLPNSGQEDSRAALPTEQGRADNRVPIPTDSREDNRAQLPPESQTDHRATLPTDSHGANRATIDSDASSNNRVALETDAQTANRATLQDDGIDSRSPVNEGTTSSQSVSIPSDSIQDSFATTPDMTHSDSSPVKVDGHGITDPDRVIIDNASEPLAQVPVPHSAPQATTPSPDHEAPPVVAATVLASASAPAKSNPPPAQVTGHLVDKKAEEFRGRVVKLRDEVDKLNHRLDEIKK